MSNSSNNLPKPLHHRNIQNLQEFVIGSSWSNNELDDYMKQNYQFKSENNINKKYDRIKHAKIQSISNEKSLFDQYNKNNLLLRQCDIADIQILSKNPVAYEENLTGVENCIQKKGKYNKNVDVKSKTMQNINYVNNNQVPSSETSIGMSK